MFDYLIPMLWAASAVMAALGCLHLSRLIREEQRSHLDQPPAWTVALWPLVKLLQWPLEQHIPGSLRSATQRLLDRSGLSYQFTVAEFICTALALAVSCTCLFLFLGSWAQINLPTWLFAAIFLLSGAALPLKTRDHARARGLQIVRQLPVYLDFMLMAVEAGINLNGAIQQAVRHGPPGAMRDEWSRVLRDIRTGLSRKEALLSLSDRCDLSEIRTLVSTLAQAEISGSGLVNTLRTQALQRRVERFQRAEKHAMQAPVKLIFPLVVFIFPVTFLVLAFPMLIKLKDTL